MLKGARAVARASTRGVARGAMRLGLAITAAACGTQAMAPPASTAVGKDALEARLGAELAPLAAAHLACAAPAVRPVANVGMPATFWTATGCGAGATYLAAMRVEGGAAPGAEEHRFARLGAGSLRNVLAAALAGPPEAEYALAGWAPTSWATFLDDLANLDELVTQASRDLDCPPSSLVPSTVIRPRALASAVVEGCGHRATYLPGMRAPFRVAAVVPIR